MSMKSLDRMMWLFYRESLAARCYYRLINKSARQYGLSGPPISGIVCETWPEAVKRRLRRLCRAMNRYSDSGLASKPRGMHKDTALRLRNTTLNGVRYVALHKRSIGRCPTP